MLTKRRKFVPSVPISRVEHGIAEIAFKQGDLVPQRSSVGIEVRCGGLKGKESTDLSEALQTFPSPLPCQLLNVSLVEAGVGAARQGW